MNASSDEVSNTINIFHALYIMIWPIVSILMGLLGGTSFGILITFLIFVITLIRTPMHMVKMLYVTATTQECFKHCQYFDPLLRVVVFLLVPVVHVLWLGGITVFSLTCGTMYYISKHPRCFTFTSTKVPFPRLNPTPN